MKLRYEEPFIRGYEGWELNIFPYRSEGYFLYNLGKIFKENYLSVPKSIRKGIKAGHFIVDGVSWYAMISPTKEQISFYRDKAKNNS